MVLDVGQVLLLARLPVHVDDFVGECREFIGEAHLNWPHIGRRLNRAFNTCFYQVGLRTYC